MFFFFFVSYEWEGVRCKSLSREGFSLRLANLEIEWWGQVRVREEKGAFDEAKSGLSPHITCNDVYAMITPRCPVHCAHP
jgi:hypothetical protein